MIKILGSEVVLILLGMFFASLDQSVIDRRMKTLSKE